MEGAVAQIVVTSDGSLSTPTSVRNSGSNYTVEGGSEVGSNLFHSFEKFSVPDNESVLFNNGTDVQNIFSRVTGGVFSKIDGTIATQNPANLFLLNPSGIVFGPNASLDIGGSFVGTTAESIQFEDGATFGIADSSVTSLLSISTPTGLQMGRTSGSITVEGAGHQITDDFPVVRNSTPAGLQVSAGKTLALIGNEVNFSGGILSSADVTIPTAGGMTSVAGGSHIKLGSLSRGEVSFDWAEMALPWDYSATAQFADIHLAQQSLIDASGVAPGSIQLQGQNIDLENASVLLLDNLGSQVSNGITVRATETLSLTGNTHSGTIGSLIALENLGSGGTGDLTVTAAQLLMQDGAKLRNQTFSPADGGNILVEVKGSTRIEGSAPADPISSSNIGTITAGSTGNAGNVELLTDSLALLDSGVITSVTLGGGNAGQIEVTSRSVIEAAGNNPLTLSPSGIISTTIGSGNANQVTVNTPTLLLRESGTISSNTLSTGAAGNVEVNASEFIEIRGRADSSIVPSRIASAAEIIDLATQTAFNLPATPSGNSGSLKINTPSLHIVEGALVTARNDGPGTAGIVVVDAGLVFIDKQGSLSAIAQSGEGGNIFLGSDVLLMRHGSSVNATAGGTGNGGNINVDAPILIGLENSDIVANASQGNGGRIDITAQGIFGLQFRDQLTPENDITASSEFGVNGTVTINNFSLDPNAGLVELPDTVSDANDQIAQGCDANASNAFVATGRGGLPTSPTEQINSNSPWTDIREASDSPLRSVALLSESIGNEDARIFEANSWQTNANGQIELAILGDRFLPLAQSYATCAVLSSVS